MIRCFFVCNVAQPLPENRGHGKFKLVDAKASAAKFVDEPFTEPGGESPGSNYFFFDYRARTEHLC